MTYAPITIDRLVLAVLAAQKEGACSGYALALIDNGGESGNSTDYSIQFRTYGSDAYGWHDFDRLSADALRETVKAAGLKPYYRPDESRPEVILVVPDELLGAIWSDGGYLPRDLMLLPNGRYDSRNPFVSDALRIVSTYYQTLRIVPLSALLTLTGPKAVGREWGPTLKAIEATSMELGVRLSKFNIDGARTMPAPIPVGSCFDRTGFPLRSSFDFGAIFAAGVALDSGEVAAQEDAA